MSSLADDLRARSDEQLVTLLQARPDLAAPAPTSLAALAVRAGTRPSVERALAGLDRHHLDVAEAVVVLTDVRPQPRATTLAAVSEAVGADAAPALARLLDLALLTGGEESLLPLPAVVEALGPYPAGLGPPRADLGESTVRRDGSPALRQDLSEHMDDAPEAARRVLEALTWGPPIGTIDPSQPGHGTAWLLERGLLVRLSPTQVALPREVGLTARRNRTHRSSPESPAPPSASIRQPDVVAAESARAAEEVVRQVAWLLEQWDREPPVTLRTGGIGARELRRLALALDEDATRAAFVVELAATTGLLGPWAGGEEPTWLPTPEADTWLSEGTSSRWSALVRAWLISTRTPWLVGTRGERGELRAALAPNLDHPSVPVLRRAVLSALAAWPSGAAPDPADVHGLLTWRAPRAAPPRASTDAVLREAATLGVTGAGALSAAGRALLVDLTPAPRVPAAPAAARDDTVAAALDADLPPLVDDLVIQADLTGLVPGRPAPDLAALLDSAADVESRGAAVTVRFTPGSVRRALDRGITASQLLERLSSRSVTPLPQPLEYLISDVARAHGSLRVGAASSYLRSEDATALAALLADARLAPLNLRALAPTVLISHEPAARVLELLRLCDVGAVVEGPDGSVVTLHDSGRPRRAKGTTARRPRAGGVPPHPERAHLARLAVEMREGDAWAAGTDHASSPAHLVELLRDAAADGRHVQLEVAGPTGSLERRRLRPVSVEGGRLRAIDPVRESELTIAVHRIAAVLPISSG